MKLFEPITTESVALKNRIVMAPMGTRFPLAGEQEAAFYAERAKGGAGLIMYHAVPVEVFRSPSSVGNFRRVTEAVHNQDAKIGCQLFPVTFGPLSHVSPYRLPKENKIDMPVEEIKAIVAMFGVGAARSREAGFDLVEVHSCHGYLLNQFFSPADNHRTDEYGGDLWRRMRFGLEIVAAIRAAVGRDYPLFFRLAAWEDRPGGINLDDAIAFALELEKAGVDALDISVGASAAPRNYICPTKKYPLGSYVPYAEVIKKKVRLPVIGVGRINTSQVAEEILSQGKADLVAIGRQLICDPFWPKKVKEGRSDEILACDSCNHCHVWYRGNVPLLCRLNPRVGREWETPPPE